MRLTKKICAIVLALVLLVSCMSVFTVSAATAVITPTGYLQSNHTFGGGTQWLIWLHQSGTFPSAVGALYAQDTLPVTLYDVNGNVLAKTGDGTLAASFLNDGDYLCPLLYGSYTADKPNGLDACSVIKVDAGTYASNQGDGNSITIEKDIYLVRTADGYTLVTDTHQMGDSVVVIDTLTVLTGGTPATQIYTGISSSITGLTYDGDWKNRFFPADPFSGIFYTTGGVTKQVYPDGNTAQGMPVENYTAGVSGIGGGIFFNGFGTAVAGDTLTVQGDWYSTFTGEELRFYAPVTFTFDGSAWTRTSEVPDTTVYSEYTGSFNNKNSQVPNGTSAGQLYLKGSDSLDAYKINSNDDWSQRLYAMDGNENGVFLDGVKVNGAPLFKYSDYSNRWFTEGFAPSAGSILTIKGTFYSKALAVKVHVDECKFLWDGTKWSDYIEYTYHDFAVTGVNQVLYTYESDGTTIKYRHFYLNIDGTVPGSWDKFLGLQISVNGGEKQDVRVGNNGSTSVICFDVHSSLMAADIAVGTTMTLHAGSAPAIDGAPNVNATDAIRLTADYTLEWTGTEWVKYVDYTEYTGTLTTVGAEAAGGTSNIYLKGSDSLAGYGATEITDWQTRMVADNEQSGVFLNGVRVNSNTAVFKYSGASNGWFAEGFAATTGDVLTIKGNFTCEKTASKITIEESKFVYDGSVWSDYIEYDTITFTGGVNNSWNAEKVWWDIHYVTNETIPGTAWSTVFTGLTVEIDGVVKSAAIKKASDKTLNVFMNQEVSAPVEGTIVTLKAGKGVPSDDSHGISIEQDVQMVWNGTTLVPYDPELDVTYNDITLDSVYSASHTDHWVLNINVNGNWPSGADFENYTNLRVFVNDVEIDAGSTSTHKNGNYLLLTVWGAVGAAAPVNGDTLTVKAGKAKMQSDTTVGINLTEDFTVSYDGTKWVVPGSVVYDDVTITEINNNSNTNVHLYLNLNAPLQGENWETIDGAQVKYEQKITINGTEYTVTAKKFDTKGLFLEFPNSYLTKPGNVIVVKAGQYASNIGSYGYNLTADYVMTYTGTGFVAGEIATTELTLTALTINAGIKADGSAWQLYMTPSVAVPGTAWGASYHQIVTVDGVESTLTDVKNGGGTGWYATVPTSVLPLTGEHTLVLKAGFYQNQGEAVAYYLPADVTLYANQYGISLTGFIAPTTAVSPMLNFAGPENSVSGLTTMASADDGATYAADWSLAAYAGGLSADGQTRFLGESGIYLNGEQQFRENGKLTGYLKKLGTKTYYIGLADMGVQGSVTVGTVLTVKGLFHNQYGEMVEIAESSFVWDGTTWANQADRSDYTEYTGRFFIGTTADKNGLGAQVTSTNANQLYLKGGNGLQTLFDGLYEDTKWNQMFLTALEEPDSGFFLNGNKVNVSFQQYSYSTDWFFASGMNAAAAGDTLVIKGQFYNDIAKVLVNVTESTFKWDGTKWIDVLVTTVKYDVNGDGVVSALDAALLDRYLADTSIVVSDKADVNGDSVIDAEDMRLLRRYILGIEVIVVDGVAQGVPYYAGGEMMKVAYSAPSIGSFDSSTGVVTFKSDAEIDRVMDEYAAVGFTHIVTEFVATLYDQAADYAGQQLLYRYYEEAAERGMKVIVVSQYMDTLRNYAGDLSEITYTNGNTWKDIVDDIITRQMKYEAFWGFMFGDEPTITALDRNTEVAAYVRSKFPNVNLWWACFPDYVDGAAVNDDYASYVAKSGNILGHFMYDNYGLRKKESTWSTTYYIEGSWFENLQTAAAAGKENGFTTGVTMQAVALNETGTAGWFSNAYQTRPISSQRDIGFQIYTALAYGMKELDFFTYAQHPYATGVVADTAMLKSDGSQNAHYTYVKNVYANIREMEKALLNFSWEGTIASNVVTGNKNNTAFNSSYTAANNSRLNSVSVSGRAVIGCMKDQDGFDGYLIANAAEPNTGGTANVTLKFNSASKALVYWADGTVSTVSLTDGQYTFSVTCGEGAFVIPLV